MLILTRRTGEAIYIGEEAAITVKILNVRGNQVRLGITAPKDLPVHREEIYQRIQDEHENYADDYSPGNEANESNEGNEGNGYSDRQPKEQPAQPQASPADGDGANRAEYAEGEGDDEQREYLRDDGQGEYDEDEEDDDYDDSVGNRI